MLTITSGCSLKVSPLLDEDAIVVAVPSSRCDCLLAFCVRDRGIFGVLAFLLFELMTESVNLGFYIFLLILNFLYIHLNMLSELFIASFSPYSLTKLIN